MKTLIRTCLLVLVAVCLVTAAMESPGGAALLNNVSQIFQINYNSSSNTWLRTLPDGTTQPFALNPGQTLVITTFYVGFYTNVVNGVPYTGGPWRVLIKTATGLFVWVVPVSDITYPTTGSTVWGCGTPTPVESIDPGIVLTALPTCEVRQLPVPPNDPNSGPVINGTKFLRITGYVTP